MKSSYIRVLFAVAAALCLLVSVSCSGSTADESFETDFENMANGRTFGGTEFWYGYQGSSDKILGFEESTTLADQVFERMKAFEKEYDCTFRIDYMATGEVTDSVRYQITTGDLGFSAVINDSSSLRSLAKIGYLSGITLGGIIDVTDSGKWGTPYLLESICWMDDVYGVTPMSWPYITCRVPYGHIVINETIVQNRGFTDPRDYVENGTWTWDQFEATLVEDTFTEADKTIYAFQAHPAYYFEQVARSNGDTFIEKDSSGKYVCGWLTDTAVSVITRGKEIWNTYYKYCIHGNTYPGNEFIINGECVMSLRNGGLIDNEAYKMESFGVIPFPHGPAVEENFKSFHEKATVVAVPVNSIDTDFSMFILDRLYSPLEGFETKDDIIDFMTRNTFHDRRDCENYFRFVENSNYSYFSEGGRSLFDALGGGGTALELIEKNKDNLNTVIEEEGIPSYRVIEKIWNW